MHRSRILLVVAATTTAVALFLPFTEFAEQGTVNGLDGYAWPAAVAIGIAAVMGLVGDRAEGLPTGAAMVAIALCGLAVVLSAFKLADAATASDVPGASIGAGPWVLLGGCVLGLGGSVASLTRRI